MWYFAYDHLSSWRAMARVYRLLSLRLPMPELRYSAVLRNYRICFPVFREQYNGGAPSILPAPGKYVAGALFDLPSHVVDKLDLYYGRRVDWMGREHGLYRRSRVQVQRFDSEAIFFAATHEVIAHEGDFCPPSIAYIRELVSAACDAGLSSAWIEHLLSFRERGASSEGIVEDFCTSAM